MRPSFASKLFASLGLAASVLLTRSADAQEHIGSPPPPTPPVDVAVKEPPGEQRLLTVEWNPLSLLVAKLSANVIVTPGDHHALVVAPFYAYASTAPLLLQSNQLDMNGNPIQVSIPTQSFDGFGGEIGYRYYYGYGGPRGFFLGGSIIAAAVTGTAGNGSKTTFLDYGVALDAGYQMLVVDRVSLSAGLGVQYTTPSTSIPTQQEPASIYSNSRVLPRFLLSVGYAF